MIFITINIHENTVETISKEYSLIAQLVECRTVNPLVAGSSPARGANIKKEIKWQLKVKVHINEFIKIPARMAVRLLH